MVSEDSIRETFEELSYKSRVDQEQIHKMSTINEYIIELCQQPMETNQEQGKKTEKLILKIDALTKLLPSNGTRDPPQEYER